MKERQIKLTYHRKLNGYSTQKDMAEALGISMQSYHRKESGEREFTEKEIIKLLNLLNVHFEELFLPSSQQIEENNNKTKQN